MDSSIDPSSSAAQARTHDETPPAEPAPSEGYIGARPGFFSRVFGAKRAEVPELRPTDPSPTPLSAAGLAALRRLRVDDVMIPRAEIVSVPCDTPLGELVALFRSSGLTRLPVYDGTLDQPVGMVHMKDLALRFGFNGDDGDFDLPGMVRPLIYVPPSMPISVLLQKMQSERRHMALVIDEYGGVDGLVTIEDLIEQFIGEIEDEHDQEEDKLWREEKPGCYVALARTPLEDFEEVIGLSLEHEADDEIDTLGGLVFLLTGHVPARGEVVPHSSGVQFEVVDADPRRIKRLRVRLPGNLASRSPEAAAAE